MKKIVGLLSLTCLLFSVVSVSGIAANAESETLVINKSAEAKLGDTVKYILYLADCNEDIEGFEMNMNFDPDYLEIADDSPEFGSTDNVIKNVVKGEIFMNWTNVFNKLDFSSKKEFLTAEFKVLKTGETEISQFVKEMYGEDMTYLKKFTWTYEIKINDSTVVSGQPPIITSDADLVQQYQGAYINYVDGKGEDNGSSGSRQAVTAPDNSLLQNRDETQENKVGQTVTVNRTITDIQDVTRYREVDGEGSGGLPMPLIIGIGVVVFGGLIAVAVIISKKKQQ